MPAAIASASTPRPRALPQQILSNFQDAMEKAGRVCQLARGRPVNGMVECVAKLINAERQKAQHVIQAATVALAQLEG
jgi:hypothetical protein